MTRPLAFFCCAVIALSSSAALAKPTKVALTQIDGDASGDVHDAVAEALEGKELSLIGAREVNRAVDKLGDLSDLTEKDFKKLASELSADAIVTGKLDKAGKSQTLKFRLFVHKKMAKGFTVSFKDPKSPKFRAALHDKLIDKIGAAPAGGGDDDDDTAAKPAQKGKGSRVAKADKADDEDDRPAKKGKGKAKPADSDDDDAKPAKRGRSDKADKADKNDDEDEKPARKSKLAAAADDEKPSKKAKPADDEDDRPARKAKPAAAPADDDEKVASSSKPDDPDTGGQVADKDSDDAAPRKGKKQVAAADDADAPAGEVEVSAAAPVRSTSRPMARLEVGATGLQRTFTFSTKALANAPLNSKLPLVPGARVAGEIYPLASSPGVVGKLGIAFELDRTLKLNLNAATDPGVAIPVKQEDFQVGLRYRMGLGSTPDGPTLTVGAGYGKRLFSPDVSKLNTEGAALIAKDTPTTDYTVIDPGLTVRLPFAHRFAFSLGGNGLIITNAGSIQGNGSYGRALVYGFEGTAGLDVMLASHFALRIAGDFTQVAFSFKNADPLTDLDGDGKADVTALTDRSISGWATLAFLY